MDVGGGMGDNTFGDRSSVYGGQLLNPDQKLDLEEEENRFWKRRGIRKYPEGPGA